jgi:hypothetical protein
MVATTAPPSFTTPHSYKRRTSGRSSSFSATTASTPLAALLLPRRRKDLTGASLLRSFHSPDHPSTSITESRSPSTTTSALTSAVSPAAHWHTHHSQPAPPGTSRYDEPPPLCNPKSSPSVYHLAPWTLAATPHRPQPPGLGRATVDRCHGSKLPCFRS